MKQVEFIKASMLKLNESGGVILPPAPFKFVNGGPRWRHGKKKNTCRPSSFAQRPRSNHSPALLASG